MRLMSTKLYSIFAQKCPRCHEGELFINKNPYKFSNWDKMHNDCPNCHLHYEREPGFFQGAMYVSYALGVVLSVAVLIADVIIGFNALVFFIANTLSLLGLAPLLFRWARAIYLNIFITYRPEARS
jgi:uncharacterized protein (DUF983 family)